MRLGDGVLTDMELDGLRVSARRISSFNELLFRFWTNISLSGFLSVKWISFTEAPGVEVTVEGKE